MEVLAYHYEDKVFSGTRLASRVMPAILICNRLYATLLETVNVLSKKTFGGYPFQMLVQRANRNMLLAISSLFCMECP